MEAIKNWDGLGGGTRPLHHRCTWDIDCSFLAQNCSLYLERKTGGNISYVYLCWGGNRIDVQIGESGDTGKERPKISPKTINANDNDVAFEGYALAA